MASVSSRSASFDDYYTNLVNRLRREHEDRRAADREAEARFLNGNLHELNVLIFPLSYVSFLSLRILILYSTLFYLLDSERFGNQRIFFYSTYYLRIPIYLCMYIPIFSCLCVYG